MSRREFEARREYRRFDGATSHHADFCSPNRCCRQRKYLAAGRPTEDGALRHARGNRAIRRQRQSVTGAGEAGTDDYARYMAVRYAR